MTYFLISLSLDPMAMLNISLLMKEGRIWAMTLSYRRLRSLGTAGIIVGLRVFMSSVRFLMSPEKKPTDPPTRNIALWGDKEKEQVGITLWRCLPVNSVMKLQNWKLLHSAQCFRITDRYYFESVKKLNLLLHGVPPVPSKFRSTIFFL